MAMMVAMMRMKITSVHMEGRGGGERLGKEHTCTCIISNFNTLFLLKISQTQWKMDGKFVVSMQDRCVYTGFP